MGITATVGGSILRSRALAALTSPHGVDRYLEQVNPMWAAHEVRARVVDVHREVDVPGHPPVATITLQPTSTWRGHRAGQHVQVGVEINGSRRTTRVFTVSSPDSRHGRPVHDHPAGQPRGPVSRYLVERGRARARWCTSRRPRATSCCRTTCPTTSLVHHRRLRHHAGDVDAALAAARARTAAGSRSCTTRRARSTRSSPPSSTTIRRSGHGIDVHLLHPELGDPALSPA